MKKRYLVLIAVIMIAVFGFMALGSGESDSSTTTQGSTEAAQSNENAAALGKYNVEIMSCRLAEDFEGKPVVIVKYNFTNVSNDQATSFTFAVSDNVYQNGVGLNKAYVLKDNANYSADDQSKNIQKGAKIEVEVAYNLNDTTTEINVEVKELVSFDDKKITKTFTIA